MEDNKRKEIIKEAVEEVMEEHGAVLEKLAGVKYDSGKPKMSLIPPDALVEVGKVMTFGAEKYDENNWRKGINYERLLSAAERHIVKFGSHLWDDVDEESGVNHLAHAVVNLLMLLQFELEGRTELDDRYKGPYKNEKN